MHTRSRFLSLMFAVTLTASMASYLPGLPAPPEIQAAAADTEEEPDASTNMTIDFNYETNKHVTTPDESFLRIGAEGYEKETYLTPESNDYFALRKASIRQKESASARRGKQ